MLEREELYGDVEAMGVLKDRQTGSFGVCRGFYNVCVYVHSHMQNTHV